MSAFMCHTRYLLAGWKRALRFVQEHTQAITFMRCMSACIHVMHVHVYVHVLALVDIIAEKAMQKVKQTCAMMCKRKCISYNSGFKLKVVSFGSLW